MSLLNVLFTKGHSCSSETLMKILQMKSVSSIYWNGIKIARN